ncbi:MAG: type II toxin-antitoxin system RelE/ParE family toxin [Bacteroides sp.]|nr:type II toxin-antitoxin system RelE/ParE family toxin [Bacteroides sp.]
MQVVWTQRALRRLNIAVNYGLYEFGEIAAHKFYQKIRSYEPLLATNPYMGKVEKLSIVRRYEYRSLVVHPHFKLIYYVNEVKQRVVITYLFDTRQDPAKLS